jgi:hypothetical protein
LSFSVGGPVHKHVLARCPNRRQSPLQVEVAEQCCHTLGRVEKACRPQPLDESASFARHDLDIGDFDWAVQAVR